MRGRRRRLRPVVPHGRLRAPTCHLQAAQPDSARHGARPGAARSRPADAVRLRRQGSSARRRGQGDRPGDVRPQDARRAWSNRVVFIEDYDLSVADRLIAGCDVWLNLPRPPFEASGTSGMKAAFNGCLNLSVLDGWWAEAFDGSNGWAIDGDVDPDEAAKDERDAAALYG